MYISTSKNMKWTKQQEEEFRQLYPSTQNIELVRIFGGTTHSLTEMARRRGLKKNKIFTRKGDLSSLFEETPKAYQWLGFLMADGYISKEGHLMVSQSDKDSEFLFEFGKFVNCEPKRITPTTGFNLDKYYRVSIKDKILGVKLKEKMGITENKTYNPPDLSYLDADWKIKSFLIGLLNGDGSREGKNIRLECHFNWRTNIEFLVKDIPESSVKINSRGYTFMRIKEKGKNELLDFAERNNLKLIRRKWYEPV